MNARVGMAEKLSIQQLTKAVQDGTVPSFIGIPLIQEKMKEQTAAGAMQPKAPPIAQQVMQQAEAMQGVPALPSNMPQEYAQGGILSYAGGGDLYDDEDYDPEDDAQVEAMSQGEDLMDQLLANPEMYASKPEPGIESLREVRVSPSGRSMEAREEKVQTGDGTSSKLLKHILHKESRGQRYDKEGNLLTSSKGAMGEMQVMPATARDPGFGIAPARGNDPEELRRVGEQYAQVLLNKYRDPKLAAIAYNWGPGNTDKWLSAGADISRLPQETRGYIQGMAQGGIAGLAGGGAIHFQNRGIVDGPSADPDTMSQIDILGRQLDEARAEVSGMKLPGQRQLQADPSLGEKYNAARDRMNALQKGYENLMESTGINKPAFGMYRGALGSKPPQANPMVQAMSAQSPASSLYESAAEKARLLRQNSMARGVPIDSTVAPSAPAAAPAAPAVVASAPVIPFAGNETPDLVSGAYGSSTPQAATPAPTEPTTQASPASGLEELLAKREAGVGKQRDIDNYMALLSAGLGMMGGTSPFAAANIGQGAQAGIKTYGDSATRRAAEENAILSGRLGAYKYAGSRAQADAMMQLRKDLQNNQLGYNKDRLAQLGEEKAAALAEVKNRDLQSALTHRYDTLSKNALKASESIYDPVKKQAYLDDMERKINQDKLYRQLHKERWNYYPSEDMGGATSGGGTRLKFDAQGQQIK
jgi:soluble lytic murein transglycosylase-like protein